MNTGFSCKGIGHLLSELASIYERTFLPSTKLSSKEERSMIRLTRLCLYGGRIPFVELPEKEKDASAATAPTTSIFMGLIPICIPFLPSRCRALTIERRFSSSWSRANQLEEEKGFDFQTFIHHIHINHENGVHRPSQTEDEEDSTSGRSGTSLGPIARRLTGRH